MKERCEEEILLSILIPNLGYSKKVFHCLDSLLRCSTSKELFEIIFFDQSDKNESLKLETEIGEKYHGFIKFFHGDLKSLYFARHSLMKLANGEYCAFVDSDDYVEPNYIDSIFSNILMYNYPDLLIYDFFINNKNGNVVSRNKSIVDKEIKYPLECFVLLSSINSIWRKVFKRSLYNVFEYDNYSEIKIGEDKIFSYPIMLASKTIAVLRDKYYHYVLSSSSMMSQANFKDYIKYIELPIHSFKRVMNNNEKKMLCSFLCSSFLNLYKSAMINSHDFLLLFNAIYNIIHQNNIEPKHGSTLKEKFLTLTIKNKRYKLLYSLCKRKT